MDTDDLMLHFYAKKIFVEMNKLQGEARVNVFMPLLSFAAMGIQERMPSADQRQIAIEIMEVYSRRAFIASHITPENAARVYGYALQSVWFSATEVARQAALEFVKGL